MPEFGDVGADQASPFGIGDRRLDQVRKRHGPVAAKGVFQSRQCSRGGDGLVTDLVYSIAQDETPAVVGFPDNAVRPHIGTRGGRGAAVEVDFRLSPTGS
jgi:hypothetical protein